MSLFIKILQVILSLSVLVSVHELGHFLFARMFGIRVDKFFLFFDFGGFKLLSTKEGWFSRLFPRLKKLETEYGIGWMPVGGYCKINGMVDESMDTEYLMTEPKPWEFRSHPAWQRVLVMSGGVLFNFITAVVIYCCMLGMYGQSYLSNEENRIYVNELAFDMGFRNGDRILRFDDYEPENFGMLQAEMARRQAHTAVVLRGTDTLTLYLDRSRISEVLNSMDMFSVAVPFIVDSIPPGTVNAASGIVRGDRIIAIDGREVEFVQDSRPVLAEHAGGSVTASVLRAGDTLSIPLRVDTTGRIGVFTMSVPGIRTREYNAITAIPAGFRMTFSMISGYLKDLKMVATPSTGAYKSVGSFVAIGQAFPGVWNWSVFFQMLAMLSVMLAIMNLLPIPALDGGHIVLTLYEIITGRKPGEKFLIGAQMVGMALLFALMFLAFGNDIGRLIK